MLKACTLKNEGITSFSDTVDSPDRLREYLYLGTCVQIPLHERDNPERLPEYLPSVPDMIHTYHYGEVCKLEPIEDGVVETYEVVDPETALVNMMIRIPFRIVYTPSPDNATDVQEGV